MSWGRSAGGPQINYMLARKFRERGHTVDKFDIDDAFPEAGDLLERIKPGLFKLKSLQHIRNVGDRYDVIQAEQGAVPFSKSTLHFNGVLVSSSVGLAHFYEQYSVEYRSETWEWDAKSILRQTFGWIIGQINNPLWAVDRSFKAADLISLSSEDEYEYVANELGHSSKVFLRQNGLAKQRLNSLREEAAPATQRLSNKEVAFIGYWNHRKGAHDWPGIVKRVCEQMPTACFRLLGTGRSEEVVLSDLPPEYRSRVTVIPRYEYEQLPKLLTGSTVGVLPSYVEGWGLGVHEMLASRIPVVTYDIPGPRDMLRHLPRPMMVPVGHEEKLASKVTEILQLRPDAYQELAQASQDVAGRFRWDEIVEQYLARVEELRA